MIFFAVKKCKIIRILTKATSSYPSYEGIKQYDYNLFEIQFVYKIIYESNCKFIVIQRGVESNV